jgi:hypothetical protein
MLSSMDASFKSSRIPVKQANQIVRDICEMSISLDASTNKVDWNEMSLNRSQNPFTSSMNMGGSFGGYGGQQQNGNSQYQHQQNNNNNNNHNNNYHGHSSSSAHHQQHNNSNQQAFGHHNYPQQHHPSQQQQYPHQQPQHGRNQPQQHHQQQPQQHHHNHHHHPESNRVGRPLQPARKRSESDDEYDNDFEAEEYEDSKTAHDNYYSRGGGEGKSSSGDNRYRK